MSRSYSINVMGTYTNQDGASTPSLVFHYAYSKSDVVKTEAHKLWLTDKTVWLPPTPYEASIEKYGYRSAILTSPLTGQAWSGYIDFYGYPGRYDGAPDMTGAYDEAVFKIVEHVKNSHVDLGAGFAEAEQTLSLIAESARKLAKAAKSAKHGDWAGAARALGVAKPRQRSSKKRYHGPGNTQLQELSNRWLELQFGWKPLLSDIDGAARFLAELGGSDPSRLRMRANATVSRPYTYNDRVVQGGTLPWQSHVNMGESKHGYRFVVWFAVTSPSAVNAAALGLTNPASVLWEVTPWSFVADWVLPIGRVLDTLDAYNGKSFIGGTRTEFYRVRAKRVNRLIRDIPQTHADTTYGYRDWTYMDRQVLTDFPRATEALLHLKNPLSVTHALDALALLSQTARDTFS